jgi:cytochrome b subunit of formate dehydrogenase
MMKRAKVNYLVFVGQVLATLLLILSALLLWFAFPRGYFVTRDIWVDIHKWSGVALAALVLIHVALHWNWLVYMTGQYLGSLRRVLNRRKKR